MIPEFDFDTGVVRYQDGSEAEIIKVGWRGTHYDPTNLPTDALESDDPIVVCYGPCHDGQYCVVTLVLHRGGIN